jgi:predicted aminopeptidase
MLKDYASTTTGGEEFGSAANDEQHIVDVSKQITDISLSGTEMTDSWISQNGTFYALVSLDLDKFEDSVKRMDQLSEAVRDAVVERAEQSFAELDDEIDKERAR